MSAWGKFLRLRGATIRPAIIDTNGVLETLSASSFRSLIASPGLNTTNVWTGSNDFRSPIVLRDIQTNPVKAVLPTGIMRGTSSDGGTSGSSTVWEGSDAGGPSLMQSPTRGQLAHSAFGAIANDGTMYNAGDPEPYMLDWSADGLKVNKVARLGLSSDIHDVTSADVTMTKMRARINSSAQRLVTLPDASSHSLVIIMVETDSSGTKHRIYPASGSEIYWTDHTGTSRYAAPAAGSAFYVTRGMYWLVSDGTYWYAMSPAAVT